MKTAVLVLIGLLLLLACATPGERTGVQTDNPTPVASLTLPQEPVLTPLSITPTAVSSSEPRSPAAEPAAPGQPVTYTLTVTNHGPSDATGVVVTDTLPGGVILLSAIPSQGTGCYLGQDSVAPATIICDLDDLAPGASASITFVVKPITAAGTLTHSAIVAAQETDSNLLDNRYDQETQIPPKADLALRVQAPKGATAGETVIYTLTATNNGWSPATGVTLTGTLPPGVTFAWSVPEQPSQPACNQLDDTLICDLGGLAGRNDATITLDLATHAAGVSTASALPAGATLDLSGPTCAYAEDSHTLTCQLGDLTSGDSTHALIALKIATSITGTITHTASVAAAEADPFLHNNTRHAVTSVSAASPPTVTMVLTGADLTIHAAVPGKAIAGVPLTTTFVITNRGPLDAADVTLRVTQSPENLPAGVSLASISPGLPECTPSESAITCQLLHHPAGDPMQIADVLTFTLAVTSEAAHPIQVALDSFLPGWPMCAARQGGVYCNLGELQRDADARVTLVANVGGQTTGTISSTASVQASAPDPNPLDNVVSTSTRVEIEADLELRSTASGPAVAGQALAYTLTITNHGLSDATDVVVTDTLPPGATLTSVAPSQGSGCRVVKDFVALPTGGTQPSHTAICHLGQLAGGEVARVAIVAIPDPWAYTVTEALTNSAAVSTSSYEPDKSNNEMTEITPISAKADLSLTGGAENQDTE